MHPSAESTHLCREVAADRRPYRNRFMPLLLHNVPVLWMPPSFAHEGVRRLLVRTIYKALLTGSHGPVRQGAER